MSESEIPTERSSLVLRQLTEDDAERYFAAVDQNREHLSQHGDETGSDHSCVEQTRSILADSEMLRFGIWEEDTFAGSIILSTDFDGAEIGYWLDERQTGNGYATMATRALAKYANERHSRVYAVVMKDNVSSASVLVRAGFTATSVDDECVTFELPE